MPRHSIPDQDRLVIAAAGKELAVGAEENGVDAVHTYCNEPLPLGPRPNETGFPCCCLLLQDLYESCARGGE